ncbi:PIN domain-containing protein [Thermococcus sp.]|uniref:PIN domain-containing protein n=1 Tax=Thermococcus sp. TaxID=35749 RepID=UPI0026254715|nr:PIN domain-containing protein [Thermococcus sp.]
MERKEWLVIPDTNFLLVPGQFGVDVISELHRILDVRFKIAVPDVVLRELDLVERKSRGRDLLAVRMAKKLAERFETLKVGEFGKRPTDDQIFDFAAKNEHVIVCTNDKDLRRRLRERGIPVVYLRSKKVLELEGMLE